MHTHTLFLSIHFCLAPVSLPLVFSSPPDCAPLSLSLSLALAPSGWHTSHSVFLPCFATLMMTRHFSSFPSPSQMLLIRRCTHSTHTPSTVTPSMRFANAPHTALELMRSPPFHSRSADDALPLVYFVLASGSCDDSYTLDSRIKSHLNSSVAACIP
jgi:hypothetical protein